MEWTDISRRWKWLDPHSLFDVYAVHKCHRYTFQQMDDYPLSEFIENAEKADNDIFGNIGISEIVESDQFMDRAGRLSLFPSCIINDDVFAIIPIIYGVTAFAQDLKRNREATSALTIRVYVVPQSVVSVYDQSIVLNVDIPEIGEYLKQKEVHQFESRLVPFPSYSAVHIAKTVTSMYDDNQCEETSDFVFLCDRRNDDNSVHKVIVFECKDWDSFSELRENNLIGFDLEIGGHDDDGDDDDDDDDDDDEHQHEAGHGDDVVRAYLNYGIRQRIRFYPEFVVSVFAKLFVTPSTMTEYEYLQKLYSAEYKKGWNLNLDDQRFNDIYKAITGTDHETNNYYRSNDCEEDKLQKFGFFRFVEDRFDEKQINAVKYLMEYWQSNLYDSDSVIFDILDQNTKNEKESNIERFMETEWSEWMSLKQVVFDWTQKECGSQNVSNVPDCAHIQRLIENMKEFKANNYIIDTVNMKHFNLRQIIGDFDHLVSVHNLFSGDDTSHIQRYIADQIDCDQLTDCLVVNLFRNRRRENEKHSELNDSDDSVSSECAVLREILCGIHCYLLHRTNELYRLTSEHEEAHAKFTSLVKGADSNRDQKGNLISEYLGMSDYVKKHYSKIKRVHLNGALLDVGSKVEVKKTNYNYYTKERTERWRLGHVVRIHPKDGQNVYDVKYAQSDSDRDYKYDQRVNQEEIASVLRIPTDDADSKSPDEQIDEEVGDQQETLSLDFGVSVVQWLHFGEDPLFQSLRDEMTQNIDSTVSAEGYDRMEIECAQKIKTEQFDDYSINEMIGLKFCSDLSDFTASLRKAHWMSMPLEMKKRYYHWARTVYRAALRHAVPVPVQNQQQKGSQWLYHGLTKLFRMDQECPTYFGLFPATLSAAVCDSFSDQKGLRLHINSEYGNAMRRCLGINMESISMFKREREVLLVDQPIPIRSSKWNDAVLIQELDQLLGQYYASRNLGEWYFDDHGMGKLQTDFQINNDEKWREWMSWDPEGLCRCVLSAMYKDEVEKENAETGSDESSDDEHVMDDFPYFQPFRDPKDKNVRKGQREEQFAHILQQIYKLRVVPSQSELRRSFAEENNAILIHDVDLLFAEFYSAANLKDWYYEENGVGRFRPYIERQIQNNYDSYDEDGQNSGDKLVESIPEYIAGFCYRMSWAWHEYDRFGAFSNFPFFEPVDVSRYAPARRSVMAIRQFTYLYRQILNQRRVPSFSELKSGFHQDVTLKYYRLILELDSLFGVYFAARNRKKYYVQRGTGIYRAMCQWKELKDDKVRKQMIEDPNEHRSEFLKAIKDVEGSFPCFEPLRTTDSAELRETREREQLFFLFQHIYEYRTVPVAAKLRENFLRRHISWRHLAQSLKHEMCSEISTKIRQVVEIGEEEDPRLDSKILTVKRLIADLQEKGKLTNKEITFIRNAVKRAREFRAGKDDTATTEHDGDHSALKTTDFSPKWKGLSEQSLFDVYAVHKCHRYTFRRMNDYPLSEFIDNVKAADSEIFGNIGISDYVEKHYSASYPVVGPLLFVGSRVWFWHHADKKWIFGKVNSIRWNADDCTKVYRVKNMYDYTEEGVEHYVQIPTSWTTTERTGRTTTSYQPIVQKIGVGSKVDVFVDADSGWIPGVINKIRLSDSSGDDSRGHIVYNVEYTTESGTFEKEVHEQDVNELLRMKENQMIRNSKVRLSLFPSWIIDDDLFSIIPIIYGVTDFAQNFKKNRVTASALTIRVYVAPRSVVSIYDQSLSLNVDIPEIEEYLKRKEVHHCRSRLIPLSLCSADDIAKTVGDLYGEFQSDLYGNPSDIVVLFDRRNSDDCSQKMVVFECAYWKSFGELRENNLIGFDLEIGGGADNDDDDEYDNDDGVDVVRAYLNYGIRQRIRFYPEFMVSVVPKLFVTPSGMTPYEYLQKLYSAEYKKRWNLNLDDQRFNDIYKAITGTDHETNNYYRGSDGDRKSNELKFGFLRLVERRFSEKQLDHLSHLTRYWKSNLYDSDAVIEDILIEDKENNERCNTGVFMEGNTRNEWMTVKQTVFDWQQMECEAPNVFNIADCAHIARIIANLKRFKNSKYIIDAVNRKQFDLGQIICDFDHLVSVHKMFSGDDTVHIQRFIANQVDCELSSVCLVVNQFRNRRRENEKHSDSRENDDIPSGYVVLKQILCEIHTYLLHRSNELYRLSSESDVANLKFSSIVNVGKSDDDKKDNENDDKKDNEDDDKKDNEDDLKEDNVDDDKKDNEDEEEPLPIDFGISVIQWLSFGEKPSFETLREEMCLKEDSTITHKGYERMVVECAEKIKSKQFNDYHLDELMGYKFYTDYTTDCTNLRKAHWTIIPKAMKKRYYHWARTIHRAALRHAVPIPIQSEREGAQLLYHGLSLLFRMDRESPLFFGPLSTTPQVSVSNGFANGKGLRLSIKSGYENAMTRCLGVDVQPISCYTGEAEVLLVDQPTPIQSTFTWDSEDDVLINHLLYSLKTRGTEIRDRKQFYNTLGLKFKKKWIKSIANHRELYTKTQYADKMVITRLIEELNIFEVFYHSKYFSSALVDSITLDENDCISLQMDPWEYNKIEVGDPKPPGEEEQTVVQFINVALQEKKLPKANEITAFFRNGVHDLLVNVYRFTLQHVSNGVIEKCKTKLEVRNLDGICIRDYIAPSPRINVVKFSDALQQIQIAVSQPQISDQLIPIKTFQKAIVSAAGICCGSSNALYIKQLTQLLPFVEEEFCYGIHASGGRLDVASASSIIIKKEAGINGSECGLARVRFRNLSHLKYGQRIKDVDDSDDDSDSDDSDSDVDDSEGAAGGGIIALLSAKSIVNHGILVCEPSEGGLYGGGTIWIVAEDKFTNNGQMSSGNDGVIDIQCTKFVNNGLIETVPTIQMKRVQPIKYIINGFAPENMEHRIKLNVAAYRGFSNYHRDPDYDHHPRFLLKPGGGGNYHRYISDSRYGPPEEDWIVFQFRGRSKSVIRKIGIRLTNSEHLAESGSPSRISIEGSKDNEHYEHWLEIGGIHLITKDESWQWDMQFFDVDIASSYYAVEKQWRFFKLRILSVRQRYVSSSTDVIFEEFAMFGVEMRADSELEFE